MRTKTTKEIERLTFEQLSTWSILAGVTRELYRRFSTEMWATLFFLSIGVSIWNKLG
jgi:hypothetical protein